MAQYDVIIIGGGPGGYNAAIRAGQLGLKAAVVEKRGTLGGTCLNVGCMPSKALLHASELYEAAGAEFATLGIEVKPKLNLVQMMKQKAESVSALTKGIEFLFKKNKVDWIKGAGRITGAGKVEVAAEDGSIAGLLGASPGASTAASIMLGLLKTCFPDRIDAWEPELKSLIPSYGQTLNGRPDAARATLAETARVLDIDV